MIIFVLCEKNVCLSDNFFHFYLSRWIKQNGQPPSRPSQIDASGTTFCNSCKFWPRGMRVYGLRRTSIVWCTGNRYLCGVHKAPALAAALPFGLIIGKLWWRLKPAALKYGVRSAAISRSSRGGSVDGSRTFPRTKQANAPLFSKGIAARSISSNLCRYSLYVSQTDRSP